MIELPLQVLVQNAALLLAVAVVFDALLLRVTVDRTRLQRAISGLVLGVIGVSLMLTPWQFAPGIFFDTRTVLLNIVGLFFGAIPTLAALAVMIAWRVAQGGPAAFTGIVGMLVAAGLGLGYREFRRRRRQDLADLSFRDLYLFGLGTHAVTLVQVTSLMFLTVPLAAAAALGRYWIPLLTIYPVATALLGTLLVARLRARRLIDTNARLQREVEAQLEEVRASRARIVEAGDRERRRVERDLHDGAQQRLVSLSLELQAARRALGDSADPALRQRLERAADEARAALAELRDLALGIHPLILTESGLGAAVESLADRTSVDVAVDIGPERYPPVVEGAAYFVISEALTNVTKYAKATRATVRVRDLDDHLRIEVEDDGVGGADPRSGSGIRGLADRLSALDGTIAVVSPVGGGTRLLARIPTSPLTSLSVQAL
ncbi:MAG TPA: LytS/YhcK type 5TM receptor domain-containing protein [Candidatus Limnocylindrales bacterium]|nr:LytS/YhcK type 5TM receptor domain-containing protein [Candidatus Limnocylindrales bacterium]